MIPSNISSQSSAHPQSYAPPDGQHSDELYMDDEFISQYVLDVLNEANEDSVQLPQELSEMSPSNTRRLLNDATVILNPHPDTPLENGIFLDFEEVENDPDTISAHGTRVEISNQFRSKVFEIVERAGGLRNKKVVEKAIEATEYKPSSFDTLFRNRKTLPPMTKPLYRFLKDCSTNEYATEMNQRIQNLKRSHLESQGSLASSCNRNFIGKKHRIVDPQGPDDKRKKAEEIPTHLL